MDNSLYYLWSIYLNRDDYRDNVGSNLFTFDRI